MNDAAAVEATATDVSSQWAVGEHWSHDATVDGVTSTCYWPADGGNWQAAGSTSRQDSWHMYEVTGEFSSFEFDTSSTCGYVHNIIIVQLYGCSNSDPSTCNQLLGEKDIGIGVNQVHTVVLSGTSP